jgi:[acyl-carrier-protein] S-malonyltransferase
MLSTLTNAFPQTVNPLLDQLDDTLPDLRKVLTSGPDKRLTDTPNAQPAILFTSICILRVLQHDFGVDPSKFDYFLGHSLGEFTALVAADVLPFDAALRLVRQRGLAMAAAIKCPPSKVGMFALVLGKGQLKSATQHITDFIESEVLGDDEILSIANVNSPTQLVVSGHVRAVEKCLGDIRRFQGKDPRPVKLNVSAPFHSEIMAPAVGVVKKLLGEMDVGGGDVRKVVANVTARPYVDLDEMKDVLARQCVETVRWKESIEWLDGRGHVEKWVGIGPGRVQTILVGRQVRRGFKSVLPVDGLDIPAVEYAAKVLSNRFGV